MARIVVTSIDWMNALVYAILDAHKELDFMGELYPSENEIQNTEREATPAEKAAQVLEQGGEYISSYEPLRMEQDELAALLNEMTHVIAKTEEYTESLPVFEVESSDRYAVDLHFGGSIYDVTGEQPSLIDEYTHFHGNAINGIFTGTRIEIVDDKMLLIDDETGLAVGATFPDPTRGSAFGFIAPELIDTSNLENPKKQRIINRQFKESLG